MLRAPITAILAAALLIPGCLAIEDEQLDTSVGQQEIVGGTIYNGHPAVVMLDLGGGLCTGTLVSPRVVLTAKHCLTGAAGNIKAIFTDAGNVTITATTYENHPTGDIGAVALSQVGPVPPIPANSNPLETAVGQPVRLVGYGVTSENGQDSGTKRMGMASLDSLQGGGLLNGEMATSNDPQGTCYGDSGGPNFMSFGGIEYVAGVTSRGTDVCGAGQDIAVRADSHFSWLMTFITANDPADCGADNRCAQGCAVLDTDCCVADGVCTEECGATDPECDQGGGDGGGNGGDEGGGEPGDGEPGGDTNPDSTTRPNLVGGCSAGGRSSGTAAILLLLAAFFASRRRDF
jgi:hypothetical protein